MGALAKKRAADSKSRRQFEGESNELDELYIHDET